MSQRELERLKILREAGEGQITQKQVAEQLRVTERQARRLIKQIRDRGDVAVVHGLGGQAWNRRIDSETERRAIEELRRANCHVSFSKIISPHFGCQLSSLSMRSGELGQAVRCIRLNIVEFDAVPED